MQSLKETIDAVLASRNDWRFVLLKNWPAIVGNLHGSVRIERMFDDTLVLGVYEVHWMQELHLLSRVMIRRINEQLCETRVRRIQFKLVERTEPVRAPAPVMTVRMDHRPLTFREKQALAAIDDVQLRETMALFLGRICAE